MGIFATSSAIQRSAAKSKTGNKSASDDLVYLFDAAHLVAEAHQPFGVLGVPALGEADVQSLLAGHVGQIQLARANLGVLFR